MGNCLMSCNKSSVRNETLWPSDGVETIESMDAPTLKKPSKLLKDATKIGKKKTVRFKSGDGLGANAINGGAKDGNIVRLRIVMTTHELKQILNCDKDQMNLDLLLDVARMSGSRRIAGEGTRRRNDAVGCWKPALESISEEH